MSKEELEEKLKSTKSRGKRQRIKKILGIQTKIEQSDKKWDIKDLIKQKEQIVKKKKPLLTEEEKDIHTKIKHKIKNNKRKKIWETDSLTEIEEKWIL